MRSVEILTHTIAVQVYLILKEQLFQATKLYILPYIQTRIGIAWTAEKGNDLDRASLRKELMISRSDPFRTSNLKPTA